MRGIKATSSTKVTAKAQNAKMELSSGLLRAARSTLITLPRESATVPGKIHQMTETLEENWTPKINGTNRGLRMASAKPETHETRSTWRSTTQVNSDAPSLRVRAVRGKRASATACGICQMASDTATPRA